MSSAKMPFGKYRGKRLQSIPTEYLVWLRDENENLDAALRKEVLHELGRRDDVPPAADEPPPPVEPKKAKAAAKAEKEEETVPVRNVSPMGQSLGGSIRMMYRSLAMKYHPDRGGSPDAMLALNELHDQVQELISRTFSS
jgi:hypothetical protein